MIENSVTIIIPTVNRPELVHRCVESIYNQSFTGFINCIVVDSSENQKTEKIINAFKVTKNNFKLVYKKNSSSLRPIDNWIFAIDDIESEFSKFICDDDWLEKNFIEEKIRIIKDQNVDCVISNITIHKDFSKKKTIVNDYYNFDEGLISQRRVINSFLGIDNILPVTPTASLMKSDVFKNSFYSSLEHLDCTEKLFGFDFFMSYYSSFLGNGTYLINKSLSNSWAGDDSMTLNAKKANISYCYFFALLRLIERSAFKTTADQNKIIQHTLGVIALKGIFNKQIKKIQISTSYKTRIVYRKLITGYLKKIFIKLKYKVS
jgi:glycosyltransferase involved in cell wall biosynthesis